MMWVELITVLALVQYMYFGVQVGRARVRYKIQAPAVTGDEGFERTYRVQMNTLEMLVAFLPALWMATRHWSPMLVAAVGAVYLVGRFMYARAYIDNPPSRELGFVLTITPTAVLLLGTLAGMVMGRSA
jgi:uncharacterized membrane protein YecN with MAPEG domain